MLNKSCELYEDKPYTFLMKYGKNLQSNATSGYCHRPDLTRLRDFNPPDPIPKTWYGSEDKGNTILISC